MKTNIKKLFVTLILSLSILSTNTWCGYSDDYEDTIGVPKHGTWSFFTFDSEGQESFNDDFLNAYESDDEENDSFSEHLNRETQESDAHYTPVFFQQHISLTENSTHSHSLFKNKGWADLIANAAASGFGLFEIFSVFSR